MIDFTISSEQEKQCCDWCKRWFPLEAYGLLLGTIIGSSVHVDEVWTPPESEVRGYFKKNGVFFRGEWLYSVEEAMEGEDLMILGDFHSHPYLRGQMRIDPIQSAADLDHAANHAIFGIINVEQCWDGRLRTHARWWGPSTRVRVKR